MRDDSRLILVGQVAGGFGVKGEVRVTAFTADPLALTDYGPLLRADGSVGLTLTQARPDKNGVVGRAKEITTKEEADALRGLKLHVPRDRFPEPEEDEFYLADLLGIEARSIDLGEVDGQLFLNMATGGFGSKVTANTPEELKSLLGKLGIAARDLLRTGEDEYKALGLADASLSEAQLIEAMVKHPKLIERPILIAGDKAVIGRPPEKVLELLA